MGTTTAQKKLFFNLKKLKNQLSTPDTGDLNPEHVDEISKKLNVKKEEVVSMNRRLHGKEKSLNAPIDNLNYESIRNRLIILYITFCQEEKHLKYSSLFVWLQLQEE